MKSYDLAFSLGFSCGTTQALRAAGLQFASFPLDWVGVPSLAVSVRAVEGGFAHWLEADDLKLVAEILQRHPGKVPVYVNFRNSLGNRACIELGERFCVTPSAKLDEELSLYS